MASPTKVSRKAFEEFDGVRWNAMNDMMSLSDIRDLTPIQRSAHLAYSYMSEVYNGGHEQFISNHAELDHFEVVRALEAVGAVEQAGILTDFLSAVTATPSGAQRTVLDYLEHGPAHPTQEKQSLVFSGSSGLSNSTGMARKLRV